MEFRVGTVGIVEGETVGRAEGPAVTYCIS